jgi:hypothetical protein
MATKRDKREIALQLRSRDNSIEAFIAKLGRLLDRNLSSLIERLRGGEVMAAEAATMLGGIFSELRAAGLDRELERIDELYREELDTAREVVSRVAADQVILTRTTERSLESLIQVDKRKIEGALQKYSSDISSAVMRQVVLGEKLSSTDLREQYGDRLASQLSTEIQTSVSAFSRTSTATLGKELGIELWEYLGPDDGITREFCKDCLDGRAPGVEPRDVAVYTTEEIARMDNEQGLDVMIYCGGYNCRHQWRPIDLERAKALGFNP